MKEEVIDGIKYCLDEDNLTAEVIELKDDLECDETKLTADEFMKMIFNGYEGDVIIPETVVFNGSSYCVTSIGKRAFASSFSLKSVIIPDSVTNIGDLAFENCQELESITIPNSVTSIGEAVFSRCESLTTKVVIGEEIIGGINYRLYCNHTASIIPKSGGYKGKIIIPETVVFNKVTYRVTSIGDQAFQTFEGCESPTSITIPNNVTNIGKNAFSYCSSLTKITIPNSVTSIGDKAFYNCVSLTDITIGNSVTSIGKSAFEDCKSLKTITIPDSVKCIGEHAFDLCFALASITIPDSVRSIGDRTFFECFDLKSIIIGNGVRSIGKKAFWNCKSLNSITYQDTIAQWGKIELDNDWNDKVPAKVVHCIDGDVEI